MDNNKFHSKAAPVALGADDWQEVPLDQQRQPGNAEVDDWQEVEVAPEVGYGESALRGVAQGASFGFADEITAALEAALTDKSYEQARDESRANYKAAEEANPLTYNAANIAGGVGTAFVPGLNAAKLGSAGARIAAGAAAGGAYGLGGSEADLTKGDVAGAARDTLTGAALGGAVSGAVESLSPVTRYISRKASEKAVDMALDTIHPRMTDLRKMYGTDKLRQMGQELIDQGIIRPFDTADDVYRKLVDRTKEIGEAIDVKVNTMGGAPLLNSGEFANEMKGAVASKMGNSPNAPTAMNKVGGYLDDTVAKVGTPVENPNSLVPEVGYEGHVVIRGGEELPQAARSGTVITDSIPAQTVADPSGLLPATEIPSVQGQSKQLSSFQPNGDPLLPIPDAPTFAPSSMQKVGSGKAFDNRPRTMDAVDAWELQKDIGSAVNYGKKIQDLPESQQALETIRKRLSDKVKAADPTIGKATLPEGEMAALQKQYHLLETAEGIAQNEAMRLQANQSLSLGDMAASAAGAAALGPSGLLFGVGKKLARTRGASTAAWGLDKLSKVLATAPEAFGSYGPALKQAASRGSNSLAVHHYLLSQRDPEYRKLLESLQNQ
jgi:hypothetical protein